MTIVAERVADKFTSNDHCGREGGEQVYTERVVD